MDRESGRTRNVTSMARARSRVSVERRRADILEATREVVLEKGFGGTRIQDVAAALDVSQGLIHYHFASKDDLLAETLRFAADTDIRRLEKSMASGKTALEKLDRVLREYMPGPRDQSWLLWIDAWGEALRNARLRAISEELDQSWVGLLAQIFRDGVDEGTFTCPDPLGAAWRLASMMDGLGLQVVLHKATMSRAEMLAHARHAAALELGIDDDAFERIAPPKRTRERAVAFET
jgi:AcrR family transcriptional regulator